MGGALLELVALGDQDKHLIGKPQISFFKSVYKHHTNFAIESKPQYFKEMTGFGNKISCTIERYADLVHNVMLEIHLPAIGDASTNISWINSIGHHIIEEVEIEIGGMVIDKHDSTFLEIYSELNLPNSLQKGYYKMIGKNDFFTNITHKNALKLYIPLNFWFCKNIGQALPLIALQYHEVKINIKLRNFKDCWYSGSDGNGNMNSTTPSNIQISKCVLYCDYIFLDIAERRKFAQSSHEYLIEQVQHNVKNHVNDDKTFSNINLKFNHPIKELIWCFQLSDVSKLNDWNNFSNTPTNDNNPTNQIEILKSAKLSINGNERFQERDAEYFRLVQPFYHHTRIPNNFFYCYSFAIHPEKHQPSGTLNFSRIDNTLITFQFIDNVKSCSINIYAINYNILKIMSGMGGLLYSN